MIYSTYAYWMQIYSPQGYYRRASANMAMGRFKAALRDYEAVSEATELPVKCYTSCIMMHFLYGNVFPL